MDIRIFVFRGKGCKIVKWTAQAGGGVVIPGSAQKCGGMDDGECGDGGAGLVFGLDDLEGIFEF